MSGRIFWRGQAVAFRTGDTLALALLRHGVLDLGPAPAGGHFKLLCGIGQCQACLVRHHGGGVREACLTPCADGERWHACADSGPGNPGD